MLDTEVAERSEDDVLQLKWEFRRENFREWFRMLAFVVVTCCDCGFIDWGAD